MNVITRLGPQVNGEKYSSCSLGLFMDLDDAEAFFASKDKMTTLRGMVREDRLLANLLSEPLAEALATS